MNKYIAMAVLATFVAVPAAGLAKTPQAPAAAAKKETAKATAKAAPTHATRGVVKSVDE